MENVWAIFIIHYGVKMFITKIDNFDRIHEYAKTKYGSDNVLKFSKQRAIEIINKQSFKSNTYGIVANNGYQEIIHKKM